MNPKVEQTGGDNEGAEEDDTTLRMIRQKQGKAQKRKSKKIYADSKKKKTKKLNISQMRPSQVNGNKDKGRQGNKTVLTTQNDGKVKKKKILKKDTFISVSFVVMYCACYASL